MENEFEYIGTNWNEITHYEVPAAAVLEALHRGKVHDEMTQIAMQSPVKRDYAEPYREAEKLVASLGRNNWSIGYILDNQSTMRRRAGIGNDISLLTVTAVRAVARLYVRKHAEKIHAATAPDPSDSGTMDTTANDPLKQALDTKIGAVEIPISARCAAVADAILQKVRVTLYGYTDDDDDEDEDA